MTFKFFSFSLFYIKKIQSTGNEPWEYHVDELGPGGQHRSAYTAESSKDGTIFKTKKLTHPIEHGKSEHEKVQKVQNITNNENVRGFELRFIQTYCHILIDIASSTHIYFLLKVYNWRNVC